MANKDDLEAELEVLMQGSVAFDIFKVIKVNCI